MYYKILDLMFYVKIIYNSTNAESKMFCSEIIYRVLRKTCNTNKVYTFMK